MSDSFIDTLLRTAKEAEAYAARCYAAARALGWHQTGQTVRQKRRAVAVQEHVRRGRHPSVHRPEHGAYASIWALALTLPEGWWPRDLVTDSDNYARVTNALTQWKEKGWAEAIEGVGKGYRILPHMRPTVAEVPTAEGEPMVTA